MKRKTKFLIISVIFVLFIVSSLSINPIRKIFSKGTGLSNGVNPEQALAGDAQPAKEAPDFVLSDINGKRISLSDFKGKVILIDFWATWCPFCRESIPILKSLYDEYKDKGLVVIGIALEYDKGQALKQIAKEKKISYPLAVGKERLAIEYSAHGVPTRFIVNRRGEIEKKFVGFQDRETLESALQKFL